MDGCPPYLAPPPSQTPGSVTHLSTAFPNPMWWLARPLGPGVRAGMGVAAEVGRRAEAAGREAWRDGGGVHCGGRQAGWREQAAWRVARGCMLVGWGGQRAGWAQWLAYGSGAACARSCILVP